MRRLVYVLIFTVALLAVSIIRSVPVADICQASGVLGMNGIPLGELYAGKEFKQSFVPHQKIITGIAINFATYFRVNKGIVSLTLSTINPTDLEKRHTLTPSKELARAEVPASELTERDHIFWFPPRRISPGRPLLITLSSTSPWGQAVTVWSSKTDQYRDGLLFVNGESIDGDMVFQTYYFESLAEIFKHLVQAKTAYKPLTNPYVILASVVIMFSLSGLAFNQIMQLKQW